MNKIAIIIWTCKVIAKRLAVYALSITKNSDRLHWLIVKSIKRQVIVKLDCWYSVTILFDFGTILLCWKLPLEFCRKGLQLQSLTPLSSFNEFLLIRYGICAALQKKSVLNLWRGIIGVQA